MKAKNRMVEAITTLIHQTQDGVLKWDACPPTEHIARQTDTIVESVFMAEKDGWFIRLYPYKQKVWPEEDIWYWEDRVALELSDEKKASWWRFPHQAATWDLLEAVKFKTVSVGQFLDKLVPQ